MSELRVGTILYGYCGDAFGRDSYDNKRIEAIGADWVVVRNENGEAEFATNYRDFVIEDLKEHTTEATNE